MTRINVIEPSKLSNKHLMAEYHEIYRLPNTLKKSIYNRGVFKTLKEIPPSYTMGTGHVKFFWDKGEFLYKRFKQLQAELLNRKYNINTAMEFDPEGIYKDNNFFKDYIPTSNAIEINTARINERLGVK